MKDHLAFAVVAAAFLLPMVIYVMSKLSPRLSRLAYPTMGIVCLITAAGFFSFVGWYFMDTGQLVSPGKYRPSTTILTTAPLFERIFVGAFNAGIGVTLGAGGVGMLRVGRK